jgi:Secretion system C-terminal sorting domain
MKKKIGCFLVILCCCGVCRAQQVVSSGGSTVKSEVSVNWILGGSLSDIPTIDQSTLNKLQREKLMESEISLKVYPIPATDFINIEIVPVDTGRLILELYNNSGVKILNKVAVYQPVLQLNVSDIPSGIYYLKVFQPSFKDQLFKVEKIIKK